MRLLIMRHGEAQPQLHDDFNRQLTSHGFLEAQKAGAWLKQAINQVDYALVSPFIRAQQTFQMVSGVVDVVDHETYRDIVPSGSASMVHDYVDVLLRENPEIENLLIVAHMPIVTYLLDNFCQRFEARLFPTAAIAQLSYDVEVGKAEIEAFFCPE